MSALASQIMRVIADTDSCRLPFRKYHFHFSIFPSPPDFNCPFYIYFSNFLLNVLFWLCLTSTSVPLQLKPCAEAWFFPPNLLYITHTSPLSTQNRHSISQIRFASSSSSTPYGLPLPTHYKFLIKRMATMATQELTSAALQ